MAFWSKKKKQTPPPAPPPAPLSVFLSGGRFDRDILCTLPQGTQVLGIAAEGENFPLLQFSDEATGRYYLFADEACRPAPECGKFYKELENREEELLLFSLREKDSLPQFPQDVPSFFGQDAFPLARAGFAVRAELYERVKKIARPCCALDLLLYAESAACVPAPLCKAQPLPWSTAQVLDAVRFFHAARAQLSAEKYRYACYTCLIRVEVHVAEPPKSVEQGAVAASSDAGGWTHQARQGWIWYSKKSGCRRIPAEKAAMVCTLWAAF